MKKLFLRLPAPIQILTKVYGFGILIFLAFRFLLLFLFWKEAKEIPAASIFQSMLMGFRFDTVLSGYILILPLMLHFIFSFFRRDEKALIKFSLIYLMIFYSISFFILCADIPWFQHYGSRITAASLQWTNTPGMMLKVVFEDFFNYPFLILFIILVFLFRYLLFRGKTPIANESTADLNKWKSISIYLLAIGLLFIGIRGRITFKSPIRWGAAFFSPYNFSNQLGLNPVFTFVRSYLDKNENHLNDFHVMDDLIAQRILREQLNITAADNSISTVARKIYSKEEKHEYNLVFVLMESMSANNMKHVGNENNLTPTLDSLVDCSVSISDFYSDGLHTFNGIYSSLFGFHSLPTAHHMKDLQNQQPYGGLAKTLFENGYSTAFFTTHDELFDNMAGFLLPNGFEKIISQKNFSQNEILSTLGVPDHVLFQKVTDIADQIHKQEKPFFITILTGSNHSPFILPGNIPFHPKSTKLGNKLVEYADWAIGNFLKEAATHSWFDSTIFVFTGDHGTWVDGVDHYLTLHHIPFIIHAPKIISPKTLETLGGQTDIWPTIASLLSISYVNNSMGIDLLCEKRNYYPFTSDEELCCISKGNLWTLNHGQELFFTLSPDRINMSQSPHSPLSDSMKIYTQAVMQITQQMIQERKMKN